jgi:hypothetical protein
MKFKAVAIALILILRVQSAAARVAYQNEPVPRVVACRTLRTKRDKRSPRDEPPAEVMVAPSNMDLVSIHYVPLIHSR